MLHTQMVKKKGNKMKTEKYKELYNEAIDSVISALEDGYAYKYEDLHDTVFRWTYGINNPRKAQAILDELDMESEVIWEIESYGEIDLDELDMDDPCDVYNAFWEALGDRVTTDLSEIDLFFDSLFKNADEETNRLLIEKIKEFKGKGES